eukprot:8202878-Pyramimonas_sp.AAC.1
MRLSPSTKRSPWLSWSGSRGPSAHSRPSRSQVFARSLGFEIRRLDHSGAYTAASPVQRATLRLAIRIYTAANW